MQLKLHHLHTIIWVYLTKQIYPILILAFMVGVSQACDTPTIKANISIGYICFVRYTQIIVCRWWSFNCISFLEQEFYGKVLLVGNLACDVVYNTLFGLLAHA